MALIVMALALQANAVDHRAVGRRLAKSPPIIAEPLELAADGLAKMNSAQFYSIIVGHAFVFATPPRIREVGGYRLEPGGYLAVGGEVQQFGSYEFQAGDLCFHVGSERREFCYTLYVSDSFTVYARFHGNQGGMAGRLRIFS